MNVAANDGMTPLHVAALNGNTEAALELIRHGAEKAIVAGRKGTPLHLAAVGGHVSTVKAMLEAGCPVDVADSVGWSVLHAAAAGGNAEVVREVLSTGCDMNATANNGSTPTAFGSKERQDGGSIGVDQTWGREGHSCWCSWYSTSSSCCGWSCVNCKGNVGGRLSCGCGR